MLSYGTSLFEVAARRRSAVDVVAEAVSGAALSGTISLAFSPSAALQGAAAMSATSTLAFSPSAALQGSAALSATSSLIFSPTGSLNTGAVPVNTVAPVVSGTNSPPGAVGETLSCTTGSWTNSPTSYSYQWYRAVTDASSPPEPIADGDNWVGVAISGATSSTYVLVAADEGEFIFCDVIATNGSGSSLVKSSNYVGLITDEDEWTPASLGADLVAWYKADAGLTLSGTDVTSWADQSGNGVTLTPSGTGVITYNATGFNSLPTLEFPGGGSGAVRLVSDATALAMDADTSSWFMVGRKNAGGADFQGFLGFVGNGQTQSDNNTASVSALALDGSNDLTTWYNGAAEGVATAFAVDTNYRIGAVFDGTDEKMYLNNNLEDTELVTLALATTGRLCVGAFDVITTSNNLLGKISEIVVVKRNLTTDERNSLDAYFVARWGF